jgi:transcriptional regulator GlxA family with amidase domain
MVDRPACWTGQLAATANTFLEDPQVVSQLVMQESCFVAVGPPCQVTMAGRLTAVQRPTALELDDPHLGSILQCAAALAAALNLGATTFARQVRRPVGAPPQAHAMGRRPERARRLLAGTALPARQTDAACVFADQPHLIRLSARRFATTPVAVRRGSRADATLPADD